MDDTSFKARVDKVFGSLASSRSSSSSRSPSLWSITDDEVERREWRRSADTSARDEIPCSSSFDGLLKKDRGISRRRNLDDEELEDDPERIDGRDEPAGGNLDGQDEWSIRSSIGMDRTLDYEEEEDEFDKVASGRENVGDRLYMSDVTESGSYLNSQNVLANNKDSRANHLAAKFRLKEDEDEDEDEALMLTSTSLPSTAQVKEPEGQGTKYEARPKPILKRKDNDNDNEAVFKSRKRVRFNVGARENEFEESFTTKNATTVSDCASLMSNKSSGLPDYLLNPSKYTCYSFASTGGVDDISNARACGDFRSQVKSFDRESGSDMENAFTDLPKSVTFIPKKKASDGNLVNDSSNEMKQNKEGDREPSLHQAAFPVGIAAGEVQGEISEVVEDEPETKAEDRGTAAPNPGRRYRTMLRSDDSDTLRERPE